MFSHEKIEKNVILMLVLTLITVSIGGLVEIVPLFAVAVWSILCLCRRRWRWLLAPLVLFLAILVTVRGVLKMGGYVNHYLLAWFYTLLYFGIALGSFPTLLARRSRRPKRAPAVFSMLAPILLLSAKDANH